MYFFVVTESVLQKMNKIGFQPVQNNESVVACDFLKDPSRCTRIIYMSDELLLSLIPSLNPQIC